MTLYYSFNLSKTVFQTPLSLLSRKMAWFLSYGTDFISDNYFILLFFFFNFYQTILAAGMHPNTHRCHLVLKFKHWMPTARDYTHSLGIFMQRYGHGLSCEHTSSSRTLWLTFSTAALSHSRQTSQGISQCFRAETGCISLFEKLQPAQKNWERKEKVECISLKTRNNQRWKSSSFLSSMVVIPRAKSGCSSLVLCSQYSCSEVETSMHCRTFPPTFFYISKRWIKCMV